jgi:hypothetical protein
MSTGAGSHAHVCTVYVKINDAALGASSSNDEDDDEEEGDDA